MLCASEGGKAKKLKYTPGPWNAGRADMATIEYGAESKWIYGGKNQKYVALASGIDIKSFEEVMSNAFLIAAAPDLYEALKAIMEAHGPGTLCNDKIYMDAVKALYKADLYKMEGA